MMSVFFAHFYNCTQYMLSIIPYMTLLNIT